VHSRCSRSAGRPEALRSRPGRWCVLNQRRGHDRRRHCGRGPPDAFSMLEGSGQTAPRARRLQFTAPIAAPSQYCVCTPAHGLPPMRYRRNAEVSLRGAIRCRCYEPTGNENPLAHSGPRKPGNTAGLVSTVRRDRSTDCGSVWASECTDWPSTGMWADPCLARG